MADANEKPNYAKLNNDQRRHHARWKHRVLTRRPRLVCQWCGGGGECVDDVILDHALTHECGYCEGVGFVDGHRRGLYLRHARHARENRP